jgi:surface polysaccharide O-acyltransferase-like enzyme
LPILLKRTAMRESGRQQRNNAVSLFSVIMCAAVIFIHVTSEAVSKYDKTTILYLIVFAANKLCTFVVPGFIFVSALKYFSSGERKYIPFLKGRLKKVYIPYLIWVTIYYLYFVYSLHYFPFSLSDLANYAMHGTISAQFYFVIIIMQLYIFYPVWVVAAKAEGKTQIVFVLITALLTTIAQKTVFSAIEYSDRIMTSYVFYWVFGIFCGKYYGKFVRILKNYKIILPLWIFIAILHITLCYIQSRGLLYYKYAEHIHIIFCTISVMAVYSISLIFSRITMRFSAFFSDLYDASYYIFLSHVIVILIAERVFADLGITTRMLAKAVVAFIVPTLCSVAYIKIRKFFKR